MPGATDTCNQLFQEFRDYLETLTYVLIDPRLRSEFSDIIQGTLLEAWHDLGRIETLDADGRKRWLRTMLRNNVIDRIRARRPDSPLTESPEPPGEDTSPSERLANQEIGERVLEALSKLESRQREALVLQKYHGWTLAQIAAHLGCTTGAVAGLHARGLRKLHQYLTEMGISHA